MYLKVKDQTEPYSSVGGKNDFAAARFFKAFLAYSPQEI
jgi:hypothetical protein